VGPGAILGHVVLGGLSAQLISELVAFAGPVAWLTVARAL